MTYSVQVDDAFIDVARVGRMREGKRKRRKRRRCEAHRAVGGWKNG